MLIGDTVQIQGLVVDQHLNGTQGSVIDWKDGRWSVVAAGGMRLALRPENLCSLRSQPSSGSNYSNSTYTHADVMPIGKDIMPIPGYCVEINPASGQQDRGIGVISEVYDQGKVCLVAWPDGEIQQHYTGKGNIFHLILATKPIQSGEGVFRSPKGDGPNSTARQSAASLSFAQRLTSSGITCDNESPIITDNEIVNSTRCPTPFSPTSDDSILFVGKNVQTSVGVRVARNPKISSERGLGIVREVYEDRTCAVRWDDGGYSVHACGKDDIFDLIPSLVSLSKAIKRPNTIDSVFPQTSVLGREAGNLLSDHSGPSSVNLGDLVGVERSNNTITIGRVISRSDDSLFYRVQLDDAGSSKIVSGGNLKRLSWNNGSMPAANTVVSQVEGPPTASRNNVDTECLLPDSKVLIGLDIPASIGIRVQVHAASGAATEGNGVIVEVNQLLSTCTVQWDSGKRMDYDCGKDNLYQLEPAITLTFQPKLTPDGFAVEMKLKKDQLERAALFNQQLQSETVHHPPALAIPEERPVIADATAERSLSHVNSSQPLLVHDHQKAQNGTVSYAKDRTKPERVNSLGLDTSGTASLMKQDGSGFNLSASTTIGISLQGQKVITIEPGSSASLSQELDINDEIIAVDGHQVSVNGMVLTATLLNAVANCSVMDAIIGSDIEHSIVTLTIRKATTGRVSDIRLERKLKVSLTQESIPDTAAHANASCSAAESAKRDETYSVQGVPDDQEIHLLKAQVEVLNRELRRKDAETQARVEEILAQKQTIATLQASVTNALSNSARVEQEKDDLRIVIGEQQAKLAGFESKLRDSLLLAEHNALSAYSSFLSAERMLSRFGSVRSQVEELHHCIPNAANDRETASINTVDFQHLSDLVVETNESLETLETNLRNKMRSVESKASTAFQLFQIAQHHLSDLHFTSWQNASTSFHPSECGHDQCRV